MLTNAKAAVEAKAAAPAKIGPSLPLDRYAGSTRIRGTAGSPWLAGQIGLTINFNETPRMSGPLEHYQYDTFIARFDDKGIEPAYVTFGLDAEGKVERDHDEAGVADRGLQLRLSGSELQAGRGGRQVDRRLDRRPSWHGGTALQSPRWRPRFCHGRRGAGRGADTYDLLIRSGTIYDGSGGDALCRRRRDQGRPDRLCRPARARHSATKIVDANGLAVAPGFINMLSWATRVPDRRRPRA